MKHVVMTELDALLANRANLAEAIRSARELGDLAENAEYQTARSEQEPDRPVRAGAGRPGLRHRT